MENLISYLAKSLAGEKYHNVRVKLVNKEGEISLNLNIDPSIKSRFIGKDGKILNAFKDYLRIVSRKFGNKKVFVKVNEIRGN